MKSKVEKDLHPHPRPALAYFIWALCLGFNFYLYLVQFGAWEAMPTQHAQTTLGPGRLLLSFNLSIILFQFPIALLIDKFGPKRMTSLIIFLSALGVLVLSFSMSHIQFWIGAFIMGLGGTVAVVNTVKIISNWFLPKQFIILFAWSIFVLVIGAILGQQLTSVFTKNFAWPSIMFNYGLIGIVYAGIFFTFVRNSQIGIHYKIIPLPEHFNLMKSVRKALKKGENYAIAICCGLAISQWFAFYGIWHVNFYKALYPTIGHSSQLLNLISMLGFGIGLLFFLYLSSYLKKRKILMTIGISSALVLSLCSIYIPGIPFALHCILDFIMTVAVSSAVLGYVMMHEKNIPALTATVIGMIVISVAIFRILGETAIISILLSLKGGSLYTVTDYQYALIIVPFALLFYLIALTFIKETHGEQTYAE